MINWANFEANRENAAAGYRCEQCGCEPCECDVPEDDDFEMDGGGDD